MNSRMIAVVLCGLFHLNAQGAQKDVQDFRNTSLDFETRAVDLVERMTLEEKISQLGNSAAAIDRLGVPAYNWWSECLHGVARAGFATVFPQPIGLAATFDKTEMYRTACVISDEARAKHHEFVRNENYDVYRGLTFWSPNINIFRDPRWGRGHETYGEDPYLTGQLGIQFVRGLQGDDPKYLKVVATAKHYAVHNGPEPDRHHFNVVLNTRDLWETYLPAFQDLIVTAKVYSVMSAYNRVDGESASASSMLLEDILRQQWGFEGYVVSDCGAINDIYANHKIVNSREEAAAIGVRRGCDLNCGNVYHESLLEAAEKGLIDEGEIDLAVYRLMLARMKLGMFDPPEMVSYARIPYEINNRKAHDDLALSMARKSMTLLKNDGLLPLDKRTINTIAVIGPNADSLAALRGNYNGDATNPITVLKGIQRAVSDETEVLYALGCPIAENVGPLEIPAVDSSCLFTTDDAGREVNGLKGQFYLGKSLQGDPVYTCIDSEIDLDWGYISPTAAEVNQGILKPEQSVRMDDFSVRWTGQLQAPISGVYNLGIVSNDGCRLYIDGKVFIDGWNQSGKHTFMKQITLEKDRRYDIKIEYFENSHRAEIHLVWQTPETETIAEQKFRQAVDMASKADVAVFVGGLDADIEGEEMSFKAEGFDGGDRTKIELPSFQLEMLKALQETGTPVVLVLMSGGAIAFDGMEKDLPAILMGWYPGQRGGDAVADVLFGEYNPAGRLPVTFYASTEELPDFRDYNMRSGKGFTYRYYTGEALYPFGHGLSYTKFDYSDLKINRTKIDDDDSFTVSVKVTNVGEYAGEEVVQLYVRDVKSAIQMPLRQLRGFERIALEQGKSKKVTFKLNAETDLRYYDAMQRQYAVEPGEFEIQVGASSGDIRLKKTIVVR